MTLHNSVVESRHKHFWLWGSLIFSIAVTFAAQYRVFDPYTINDDVRQHVYWMSMFDDPGLFKDDLLTEYAIGKSSATIGFTYLYRAANHFMSPLEFSKLLPFLLVPLSALFLFLTARTYAGGMASFLTTAVFSLLVWESDYFSGGLQRSFFAPLLLAFLFFLSTKRYYGCLAVFILQCLFYPIAAAISFPIFALSSLARNGKWKFAMTRKKGAVLFLMAVSGALLLGPVYLKEGEGKFGPKVTYREARLMDEFHPGGRNPYFSDYPFENLFDGNRRSDLGIAHTTWLVLILAVVLWRILKKDRPKLPNLIWLVPAVGVGLFVLAQIFFLKLYLPTRYTVLTIPIFAASLFGTSAAGMIHSMRLKLAAEGRWNKRFPIITGFVTVLALSGLAASVNIPQSVQLYRCPCEDLIAVLKTVDRDALIAGHPNTMDWVPTFSRRKVLVNEELSLSYDLTYYAEIKKRIEAVFRAYYASSLNDLSRLRSAFGVDYLVVNKEHYTKEYLDKGNFYYNPFNDKIRRMVQGRNDFIATRLPRECIEWENGRFIVINLSHIEHE